MSVLEKCLPKPPPVQTPMDAEEVRFVRDECGARPRRRL
jgi:hypothetical protein